MKKIKFLDMNKITIIIFIFVCIYTRIFIRKIS